MKMEEEEEERRVRLEKRLVPNVDFDDTLQVLEFYSDKYQILSNLGWV
jgi:Txe/YoeB family toxin of Txe-Axe toxin-antitoxin module